MTSALETCKLFSDLALTRKSLILLSQTRSRTDSHVCSLCLKLVFLFFFFFFSVKDLFPGSAISLMKLIFLMKWFHAKGWVVWGVLFLECFCTRRILERGNHNSTLSSGAWSFLALHFLCAILGERGVCMCVCVHTLNVCTHTHTPLTTLSKGMKDSL